MAVTAGRKISRRIASLVPRLAIVGVLFLAPAVIWILKSDRQSPIEQGRIPGRILEVTELPTQESGAADRFTVRLRDGSVVVFETPPFTMPFSSGDDVVVIRTTGADGSVVFGLERL